jgi:UDP-N-acetylglucosamine 2-epimerase (non-hydrolysing)
MVALETYLAKSPPALLATYGDVNSTGIATAHVEAGLRSFDRTMPEEINRVISDALAELLFTTSPEADDNLIREGIELGKVHFVGNPMIDTLMRLHRMDPARMRAQLDLVGPYGVVTLHRPSNVDAPERASLVTRALTGLSKQITLVLPLHPRGRGQLADAGLSDSAQLRILQPLGYVDFMSLLVGSALAITDSGGVQEETAWLGVPCLTMRPNTERPITISHGTNRLIEPGALVETARSVLAHPPSPPERPPRWDGEAGKRIAAHIQRWLADAAT